MTDHSFDWENRGKLFGPEHGPEWMRTHAQVPTPLVDEAAGILRVYFATRPQRDVTLMSFVDLDLENPRRIVHVNPTPLLELGGPGTFDEHGTMPSCAVRRGDRVYLYYSGWSRTTSVPYTNSTGLAISDDGGRTFRRAGAGPVLAKSLGDPYSATSPFVMRDGELWRMWYCSGTGWVQVDGKYEHVYDIKEAVSDDGVFWKPTGKVTIAANADEEALTRPWIAATSGGWRLWYCHRRAADFRDGAGAYTIASAVSSDLQAWERVGRDGPTGAGDGWDSSMQAYPALVEVQNRLLMLYNGNDFGASGFGLCVTDDHERQTR
jgi:hypothetical protein